MSNAMKHGIKKHTVNQRVRFHAADGAILSSCHIVESLASVDAQGPIVRVANCNCNILTTILGVIKEVCRPNPSLMLTANNEYVIISANCYLLEVLYSVLYTYTTDTYNCSNIHKVRCIQSVNWENTCVYPRKEAEKRQCQ
jgi:hypothetical protein